VQVTTETVAPREVVLTIVPDPEVVDRALQQAAREITRYRPMRGYRPGRAPYALVERVYGREVILNQALDAMAERLYHEAIQEAQLEPYQQGTLDIESQDPLVLKVNVPLVPVVKLGAYAELHIDPEPEVTITEADVDREIESLRRQHAEVRTVDRPIQMGDQAEVGILGTVDGDEFQREEDSIIDITGYLRPAGFAEALLGAGRGDVREFSLTYPEDDANQKLAGKTVDYHVVVSEVRELTLPEADDSFAKTVGDYETMEELRKQLAENLQQDREARARAAERLKAVETLIAASEIEYPGAALEREIDRAIDNQRAYAERLGFSLDTYLRVTNRTLKDLRDEIRPEAEKGLLQRLVLVEYGKQENLQLTDDEASEAFNSYASMVMQSYRDKADEVLKDAVRRGALSMVLEDALVMKAAQHLADRLTGRLQPGEQAEAGAEGSEAEPAAEAESTGTEEGASETQSD